jgi:hypothetical protein
MCCIKMSYTKYPMDDMKPYDGLSELFQLFHDIFDHNERKKETTKNDDGKYRSYSWLRRKNRVTSTRAIAGYANKIEVY